MFRIPYSKLPKKCKHCEHRRYCMEGHNAYCNCEVCESNIETDEQENDLNYKGGEVGMTQTGGKKKMTVFKLRKMLEAAEEAEKDVREALNGATSDGDTTLFRVGELSDIGNVIFDMRTFIESIELD